MLIRPVQPADHAAIARVLDAVRREHDVRARPDAFLDPEEYDLHALYASRRGNYFVAETDTGIVGGAGFSELPGGDDSTCELQRMYLLAELRGTGVGGQLLDRVLQAARELGYRTCYAESMDFMVGARRLYCSRGFELLPGPLGDTGHDFTTAWYSLTL